MRSPRVAFGMVIITRHLERGVALARRIGRPYLEFTGLAQWSGVAFVESFTRAVEIGTEAARLAERHGWTGDPALGMVGTILGAVLTWQGRAEEAELASDSRAHPQSRSRPTPYGGIGTLRPRAN